MLQRVVVFTDRNGTLRKGFQKRNGLIVELKCCLVDAERFSETEQKEYSLVRVHFPEVTELAEVHRGACRKIGSKFGFTWICLLKAI